MRKICLDPGHGGSQPGAVFRGSEEKDIVLEIVRACGRELDRGYEVFYTRLDDSTLSLQERCRISDEAGAELFVSVHCNADPDEDEPGMPEAKGEEIWYYEGSERSKKAAEIMASWIDQMFPAEPFRGIKGTRSFFVLKHTRSPAVLIEVGFIDRSETAETFQNPDCIRRIGHLIMEGIDEYFRVYPI